METLIRPSSSSLLSINHGTYAPITSPFLYPKPKSYNPRKIQHRTRSTKFGNFLDLKPETKQESICFDLFWLDPSNRSRFDAIIIGAGPAGLRLAERVAGYGIKVCCVDPSPLSTWHNNYGVWVDEFEHMGFQDCLDKTWPMASVYINDHKIKYLDRAYGRVNRKQLKTKLLENCVSNGVIFHKAKVWKVEHQEFESSIVCDDGRELKASLIVDASGFASPFVDYDKPRNHGYQIAHGILAEVESHPFDLDKMVLMDWRNSHLGNEPYLRANNSRLPTFLYAMPFDSNLVFLEETSLVSRPVLSYREVKKRMVARLRHLGIRVKCIIEDEKCLIPMGGPLPRIPQNVMAIGGNAGLVHPSTGYMVARTLTLAPVLAEAIAECLGSTRMIRGSPLYHRVWNGLWPVEKRCTREIYSFGMETLLKLDLNGTRRFFDAFFDLDPYYWHGFLSSRLSLGELAMLSLSLFGHASNSSKIDIVTKCPVPLIKLRVIRPRGGINEWLHWLPISLHKKLYYMVRQIYSFSRIIFTGRGKRLLPLSTENGDSASLSSVLKADVKNIVTMARETSENVLVNCGSVRISFSTRTPKKISERWSYPPLNDIAEAANRIREAIAERGWRLQPLLPLQNLLLFVIANGISSGYLCLSLPFSILCILRLHIAAKSNASPPHLRHPRNH